MRKVFILLTIWQIFVSSSCQYPVPEYGQVIDGYSVDDREHQLDPEEAEFERREVNRLPLEHDQRSKRSANYKIIESPGLHSHFKQIVQDEEILKTNPNRRRERRSADRRSELHSDEIEDVDTATRRHSSSDDVSVEDMPQAEKQRMNPAYYRSDDSRLMDKWVKAPYGEARSHNEDDTQSDGSSNVGIKTRTPRVNFITQQGQSSTNNKDEPDGPEAREREREKERERERDRDRGQDQTSANRPSTDDGYRKQERYPAAYPSKPYDPYASTAYDRYEPSPYYGRDPYRENLPAPAYYPYRERDLAYMDRPPAGMSRMTPPMGLSSSLYYRNQYNEYDEYLPRIVPNYYYSDKRFDMPPQGYPLESRNPYERELYRPYLYTNEVNNRPGRIIYYANLPEIVRTPGNYQAPTARYGDPMRNDYYYNNYDAYRGVRTIKTAPYPEPLPPTTTPTRISSAPVRADTTRERSYFG